MAPKREGPFDVVKIMGPVTVKLKLPPHWKIHDVFHTSLLRPFVETVEHGRNFLGPPPIITNNEEDPEYIVEEILR